MDQDAKILCISTDPVLLQTRRWILEGYFQVDCAGRRPDAAAMIESQSYDLILLCYSLGAEECRQIHDLVRTKSPQTQILALTEGSDGCAEAYSDLQIPVGDGPNALLKKVAEMIAPHLTSLILSHRRATQAALAVANAKLPPVSAEESVRLLRTKLN